MSIRKCMYNIIIIMCLRDCKIFLKYYKNRVDIMVLEKATLLLFFCDQRLGIVDPFSTPWDIGDTLTKVASKDCVCMRVCVCILSYQLIMIFGVGVIVQSIFDGYFVVCIKVIDYETFGRNGHKFNYILLLIVIGYYIINKENEKRTIRYRHDCMIYVYFKISKILLLYHCRWLILMLV